MPPPDVSLAAKVAFLKQPSSYEERPGSVEAIETHWSWLFLTEAHAYKLKKPARQPYFDFMTTAARHAIARKRSGSIAGLPQMSISASCRSVFAEAGWRCPATKTWSIGW
jgi:hypothetical protein